MINDDTIKARAKQLGAKIRVLVQADQNTKAAAEQVVKAKEILESTTEVRGMALAEIDSVLTSWHGGNVTPVVRFAVKIDSRLYMVERAKGDMVKVSELAAISEESFEVKPL